MLPPVTASAYQTYANTRQALAVSRSDTIATQNLAKGGIEYGLHPKLSALKSLYESRKLTIVGNVGALLEPVTRESFANKSARFPSQLYLSN